LGAELKNTICIIKNEKAFLSQHIGDLENVETLDYFEETIRHFQNILQIEPGIIAHDLHPEYLNTKWVSEKEFFSEKEIIGIQHHHAHIASCMAENRLDEEVIGFSMDGTGYGTDGNIWGGEVLLADLSSFERYSHLEYLPMPGGETAIREPWRMGIGYLYNNFGEDILNVELPFLKQIDPNKIITLTQMIKKGINTYQTSSLGRLFDAVAAIINIRGYVSYEGQSAVELENLLSKSDLTSKSRFYTLEPDQNNIIQTGILLEEVIHDIKKNASPSLMSLKFHNGLINTFVNIAQKIREEKKLDAVVLSGGCFQNHFLVDNLTRELIKLKFNVFTHRLVPPNDGGISLGQAVIAGKRYL
jgi:hydrogenase maturation protein HypF